MQDVGRPQHMLHFDEWLIAAGCTDGSIALNFLRCTIQRLEQSPKKFKNKTNGLITIFKGYENNEHVLGSAMEEIFKKLLQNPKFRYSGVKLFKLLYVLNPKTDSLFNTLLKCKLDYHRQEVDLYMDLYMHTTARVYVSLLISLYKQLRTEGSRIHLIAEHIAYVFRQLLTQRKGHTKRDVLCVYKALNQIGDDLTADCAIEMRQIIAQLDAISNTAPWKNRKYSFLKKVIRLHRKYWSCNDPASSSLERELNNPEECDFLSRGPADMNLDPGIEKQSKKEAEINAEERDFLRRGPADMNLDPEIEKQSKKEAEINPEQRDFLRRGPADMNLDPEIEKQSKEEAEMKILVNQRNKETEIEVEKVEKMQRMVKKREEEDSKIIQDIFENNLLRRVIAVTCNLIVENLLRLL